MLLSHIPYSHFTNIRDISKTTWHSEVPDIHSTAFTGAITMNTFYITSPSARSTYGPSSAALLMARPNPVLAPRSSKTLQRSGWERAGGTRPTYAVGNYNFQLLLALAS